MECKKILLKICGVVIKLFNRTKSHVKLEMKDIKFDRFIPYDVVIESKILKVMEETKAVTTVCGNYYNIGIVVGFEGVKAGEEPKLIKVAHFNTVEPNRSIIKVYNADDLTLLQSPLDQMQLLAALYSAQGEDAGAVAEPTPKKIKETIH